MEPFLIEGSMKTPTVNLDPATGKIELKGRSIPENAVRFYQPIYDWLTQYQKNPQKLTEVHVHLDYFNTSSSKCILDFFKLLIAIYKDGNDMVINWYYVEEDDDMLEVGQEYQSMVKIPFKMIRVPE
jgi:hypothetical protein